jgi:hypothetical protein
MVRRNCLLGDLIERKKERKKERKRKKQRKKERKGWVEVIRQGSRRKPLLDDLEETRGYWKVKYEALDRTVWRTRFGRGHAPVVRQAAQRLNFHGCENVCYGFV